MGLLVRHCITLLNITGVVEVPHEDDGLQTRGIFWLTKECLTCLFMTRQPLAIAVLVYSLILIYELSADDYVSPLSAV